MQALNRAVFKKHSLAAIGLAGAILGVGTSVNATTAKSYDFGKLADGSTVTAIELSNKNGLKTRLISYGAMWQSMWVPDRKGKLDDVILGYDTLEEYVARHQYFSITVGRYANRIAKGQFTLEGKSYQLPINNGVNSLHGGPKGLWTRNWEVVSIDKGGKNKPASVTFRVVSPDGDEGYPGTLSVLVTYSLSDDNDLTISYKAQTDKPTIINLTNHAIFNMAGLSSGRSALEAKLKIEADTFLPTDATAIPTGELAPVKGTPFDFTRPRVINQSVRDASHPQIVIGLGIDHNYNLRGGVTKTPKLAASLNDTQSGRKLTILTTEPGLQVYSGNFLDGLTPGKGKRVTRMGDGIALESQHYPDSPNQPAFPSTRLNPGETYSQTTIHRFTITK